MKVRAIRVEGKIAYVPLTKGREAVIDADDVYLVEGRNWHADVKLRRDGTPKVWYAASKGPRIKGCVRKTILMHRIIASTPDGMDTDHVDGNGLDNRRVNLRTATRAQNLHNKQKGCNNTSGVKGVTKSVSGKWRATIVSNGKSFSLGSFEQIGDAAAAYARASAEFHGEFGRLA